MAAKKAATSTTTTTATGPKITTTTAASNGTTSGAVLPFHDYRVQLASGATKKTDFNPDAEGPEGNLLYHNVTKPQPKDIWQKYLAWSLLGGFIPIPFVDMGAIALSNYFMVQEIADYYHQPFDSTKTRAIIASVIAGVLPQSLTAGLPGAVVRMIPVVGPVASFLVEPGFAALVTYVVAQLAIQGYATTGDIAHINKDFVLAHIQRAHDLGVAQGAAVA